MKHKDSIQAYITGQLSEADSQLFEKKLAQDPGLQKQVGLYENLYRIGKEEERKAFKKQLDGYDAQTQIGKSKISYKVIKWLVAAILFIGLAVPAFLYFNQATPQKLFAENFTPYRNVIAPIERSNQVPRTIQQKAFEAYENKDYQKAVLLFEQLPDSDTTAYKQFYIGNCQLSLGKTEAAILAFNNYIKTNGKLKDRARWYIALSYLAEENKSEAIPLFKKIVLEKTYQYKKAEEILEKLK